MLTAPEVEQVAMAVPATAVGVVAQVMVLVDVGFVPEHPPLPVTVNVAVKLPDAAEGVNVASAGSAFWVHDPEPPPPDHALPLLVPPAVAPVIVMAAIPVQADILLPAVAVGVALMVSAFVEVAFVQGEFALAVRVRVTLPAVISAALGL